MSKEYELLIAATERQNNIPQGMLYRLIKQESAFNPNAVSPAGAKGIAQFMPGTALEMGINPLDPDEAIPAAGEYLTKQFKRFGNWTDALRAYNWGPGNLTRYLNTGKGSIPKETQDYVAKIAGPSTVQPQPKPQVIEADIFGTEIMSPEEPVSAVSMVEGEPIDVSNLPTFTSRPLEEAPDLQVELSVDDYVEPMSSAQLEEHDLEMKIGNIVDEVLNG